MNTTVRSNFSSGDRGPLPVVLLFLIALSAAPRAIAADWPHYRGTNHDGVAVERIRTNWNAVAPQVLWRVRLTNGFSSFTVSQGRAFTLENRTLSSTNAEVCRALHADTGAELWATAFARAGYTSGAGSGDGPRSTPCVDGNRVYVLSCSNRLACLNVTNGALLWATNLDFGSGVIEWQGAASPLIEGDYIFVSTKASNQGLVAVRKTDGVVVWKKTSEKMTQATPTVADIAGQRQVIFFAQSGLVSVDPANGTVLWRYAIPYNYTAIGASPMVQGDLVFASQSYPQGGRYAARISRSGTNWTATEAWRVRDLQEGLHWSAPVVRDGYLYGLFGNYNDLTLYTPLKCIDLATGEARWSKTNLFGGGGLLSVNGLLLVQTEPGDLVLIQPDPAAYREITRFHALAGKSWNSPAIANGRIYARSTTEGVCLAVAPPLPPSPNLSGTVQPGGNFQLQFQGVSGLPYAVLAATNLPPALWINLGNAYELPAGSGQFRYSDTNPPSLPQRFYRLRYTP